MIIRTQEDVTGGVLSEIARAGDPRFREIMSSLVRHLHAFAREVKLTETEFQAAASYIVAIGQKSSETHNEAVLMAGAPGPPRPFWLPKNGHNRANHSNPNPPRPVRPGGFRASTPAA